MKIDHSIANCNHTIAMLRNTLLLELHGTLPSYAHWDAASIERESYNDHLEWNRQFMRDKLIRHRVFSPLSLRFVRK